MTFCVYVTARNFLSCETTVSFTIRNLVCFLLGNFPASEFYIPTFQNTLFHLHRQIGVKSHLPAHEDGTECSETSAYKIQTRLNYPEESIQDSEHSESLKSRIRNLFSAFMLL